MDKLRFLDETHQYILTKEDGEEKELVSVTTLMKKHGLSPDYSMVNETVLNIKAERGRIIHKELEEYINHKQIGFTQELESFVNLCKDKNILPSKSEFMVWNDEIAGTVDVAGLVDGCTFIGDFKTTSSLHREAVAWQLSLYAYLMHETFDKYLCFHFLPDGECKIVELKPIAIGKIEELLRCERNCELYHEKELKLDISQCERMVAVQNELKDLKARKEFLEMQEESFKNFLIKKMDETGVKQIDNKYFRITYIDPIVRETIDCKRLKKEMPDVAKNFINQSVSKPTVRISLKEE